MWPKLLDMEDGECRKVLRRLELEAYSSFVSALRAQGDLTPERKSLLTSVATTLNISTERHKAEVRRAVNDEKLATIAERIGGDSSSLEWSVEGRRLIPMMPRFIPQTAFSVTANQVANLAHAHNASLPDPKETANKGSKSDSVKSERSSSPAPRNIVLPAGIVLPKDAPDLQKLEEQHKVRHHTSSYASNPASFLSALASSKHSSSSGSKSSGTKYTGSKVVGRSLSSSGSSSSSSSMKITYTKVVSGSTQTHGGQKVVMMTTPDQLLQSHLMAQTGLSGMTKVSMATVSELSRPAGVSRQTSLEDTPSSATHGQPATKHHRSKSGSKHKSAKHSAVVHPAAMVPHTLGLSVGTIPGSVSSAAVTASGTMVPTVIGMAGKRTGVQTQRPEPGMKLITQTVASSTGKLTSKTYQVSATSPSPLVKTTTIGLPAPRISATTGVMSSVGTVRSMVTSTGPRIVTLPSTMASRVSPSTTNVITLSSMAVPKSGGKHPTTTVVMTKPGPMIPGKTNVIVVQKSQLKSKMMMSPRPTAPGVMTTALLTRPKIAMTMTAGALGTTSPLQPTSPGAMTFQSVRFPTPASSVHQRTVRGATPAVTGAGGVTGMGGGVMGGPSMRGRSPSPLGAGQAGQKTQGFVRPKSPIAQTMATISADLDLQARLKGHKRSSSASPPGQPSPKVVVEEVPMLGGIMRSASLGRESSLMYPSGGRPHSEWIEYDGSPPQSASSAIKALLEFRGHTTPATSAGKPVSNSTAQSSTNLVRGSSPIVQQAIPHSTSLSVLGQAREPSGNVVRVEIKGGQAQRLEFTADQLSSVVDQFEQFIESETMEKESKKPSSSSLKSLSTLPSPLTSSPSSSSAPLSSSSTSSTKQTAVAPVPKIDPFEFVEEIISKDTVSTASSKSPSTSKPYSQQEKVVPAIIERFPQLSSQATKVVTQQVNTSKVVATSNVVQLPSAVTVAASSTVVTTPINPATTVVTESAAAFDITQMNLQDLSCQRMREEEEDDDGDDGDEDGDDDKEEKKEEKDEEEEGPSSATELKSFFDTSSGGSGSEGMAGSDSSVRASRRKRKAPTPIDEETGPSSMPSWARAAWNLLGRVMRFRGANRPKGGINAASWFTRPVDPVEVPNYYKIIKKPMDFGTIKRNLEAAIYQDFGEFHTDMMLVKHNCLKFNPPGHAARRDCEEVFQFYALEYSKTVDRWQKQMIVPPKSPKRLKSDAAIPPPLT